MIRNAMTAAVVLLAGLTAHADAQTSFYNNTRVTGAYSYTTDDEIADDIPFVGTRRVTSFTFGYISSSPFVATFKFYAVDPATGGPGALVAEVVRTNLPLGTQFVNIPLAAAEQFEWTATPGLFKIPYSTPSRLGGWFSVQFSAPGGGPTGGTSSIRTAYGESLRGFLDLTQGGTLITSLDVLDIAPVSFHLSIQGVTIGAVPAPTPTNFVVIPGVVSASNHPIGGPVGSLALTSQAPPGGVMVTFTSSNPRVVAAPSPITIPNGAGGVQFGLSVANRVRKSTVVTLTATANGGTSTATLTVEP